MSAALAAGVLSSCSKNEMVEMLPQTENPNAVGLVTGTYASKSTMTTTESLHVEGTELTFHSTNPNFGTQGDLTFTYTNNKWVAAGSPSWDGVNFGNGINLFSMYDGEANVVVNAASGRTNSAFNVAENVADQKDLVFFGTKLEAVPAGGNILATYMHALARVKMQNITTGMIVDCQSTKLKGFDGSATPKIAVDNTIGWVDNHDAPNASYVYKLAEAADPVNDMYIIPQTTNTHTVGEDAASGVSVLCMTKIGSTQRAGWESVAAYKAANPNITSVQVAGKDYDGVMYIKAVFPISHVEFANNTYYNLQLDFAGASLQYTSNNYYDKDGNPITTVGIPTIPNPETGDPVNPDPNGKIGLTVQVNAWPSPTDIDQNGKPGEDAGN